MNSCMPSRRKIASNLLWTPQGIVRNPMVTLSVGGSVCAVEVCDSPDNQPFTEFYAGLLVLDFPADYQTAFKWLRAQHQPLPELLPHLPKGSAIVVLSGLNYTDLRLLSDSRIQRL